MCRIREACCRRWQSRKNRIYPRRMRDPFIRKSFLAFARGRERLDLSVAATLTLVAGLLALGSTTVAFGGVTEDVTRHNGLATTDSVHLHWFIQHRSPTLDSIARWLTALGGPPVLVVVVVVSAFVLWWRPGSSSSDEAARRSRCISSPKLTPRFHPGTRPTPPRCTSRSRSLSPSSSFVGRWRDASAFSAPVSSRPRSEAAVSFSVFTGRPTLLADGPSARRSPSPSPSRPASRPAWPPTRRHSTASRSPTSLTCSPANDVRDHCKPHSRNRVPSNPIGTRNALRDRAIFAYGGH